MPRRRVGDEVQAFMAFDPPTARGQVELILDLFADGFGLGGHRVASCAGHGGATFKLLY